MDRFAEFFKGKKITVVGLGLLGRGLGDIQFLARCGAELIVTDMKTEVELASSLDALKEYPGIVYTLGRHELSDFQNRDLVINGPAVPLDSPFIAAARKNNIPVTMSTALFARFAREAGAKIIGVTGTRGKSTTAHLIAQTLASAGRKTILGGNVRGVSTLALLPEVTADTTAVLELDSWLLQGFRDEKLSPDIAVFTTFYPDHLNYYHGDLEAYLADKAEIFLHQRPEDTLVLGEQAEKIIQEKYEGLIPSHTVVAYPDDVPKDWKLQIEGEHNRDNAACALFALRVLRVPEELIRAGFEQFSGVPGRLEFLRGLRGMKIYNDTTSTTPEATIAGLRTLDPRGEKKIVLIAGGSDKGLGVSKLVPEMREHCKNIFFLKGSGTERIRGEFPDAPVFDALKPALDAALAASSAGDVILFSPAFTSFGMFKNEFDRGVQFVRAVESLV